MAFLEKNNVNLYVGKLPYSTTDQNLTELFGQYGQVLSARVIRDRETGRSKGFGFVEISDEQEARAAISALNNTPLEGQSIIVNEAREKTDDGRGRR
jgi:RNA recognition motif-containing protein